MRKLMWFTLGFAAACGVCTYLSVSPWLGAFCLALAIVCSLLKKNVLRICSVVALGITVGILWQVSYSQLYLQPIRQYDSKRVCETITISDYSFETGYGIAADGNIQLDNKNYRLRLYLTEGDALAPGDIVSGEFRLRLTTPNSNQGATYHQGNGIFILAYAYDAVEIQRVEKTPLQYFPSVLRKQIISVLDRIFTGDVLAFARALLLGDSSLLTYEMDTAFKLSGIRHVIAVSGLHVSILFTLVCLFSGKRRFATAIIGLPVLFLFAAVAGFTPSVVRACLMQGLMILGMLVKKEYDPPTSLAFAVLVMLVINPLTITSVSFQLSVGCIVGIFLFYQKIYHFLLCRMGQPKGFSVKARLVRTLCASVAVSVSATVATTPLSAVYFGTVSLIGVITNLLTMWVISFVFYGIMLCCILCAFWLNGAKAVGWVVSIPVRYVLFVARWLSKPSFAALYTCSVFVVAFLVFCYVLLFVFLFSKKKRPLLFTGCVAVGLVLTLLASWFTPKLDAYRVSILDVGQGQAVLFQSGGKSYLVDCGGDNGNMAADTVAQQLLSQGITEIDGIILTHYDDDHAGGVLPLLTRINAEKLYLPDIPDSEEMKEALASAYADRIVWVREDTQIHQGNMQISLFLGENTQDDNESSLCVLFQRENCDILLTGDRNQTGEQFLLEHTQLPDLEVLIVGHHGSAEATGIPLLQATRPEVAVISVGEGNYYGHPAEEVLFRLNLFSCQIYRTDTDGTITIRG